MERMLKNSAMSDKLFKTLFFPCPHLLTLAAVSLFSLPYVILLLTALTDIKQRWGFNVLEFFFQNNCTKRLRKPFFSFSCKYISEPVLTINLKQTLYCKGYEGHRVYTKSYQNWPWQSIVMAHFTEWQPKKLPRCREEWG